MKLSRILCPVDYSRHSDMANFHASLFATATDAELVYLHVVGPTSPGGAVATRVDARLKELGARVRPMVRGVRTRYEVRFGDPAGQIIELANELQVDLIVMGTHGRTGSRRLLQGSVCEQVLRHAACAVMAVKLSMHEHRSPDFGSPDFGSPGWVAAEGGEPD